MLGQLRQILKNQGARYVIFRSKYEIKRKLGLLKSKFPASPKQIKYISWDDWKALSIPFIIGSRDTIEIEKQPNTRLEDAYRKIKSGQIQYFNKDWKHADSWLTNPTNGYKYNDKKHWTEIEDISKTAGDIKFVWEKSRFSYLYEIIRYDHHYDEDNSSFVVSEILDWIDKNPINMGPNYKCSQEISLRCLNWIFAIYYYQNSNAIIEAHWQKIMHYLYWQIRHVYDNINFSRICVRNNHAITECMMIYFGGLLFPFLKESSKWKKQGKQWLAEEIAYQVYKDGTFLQFSHNYQRVLVQLLTWTISLSKIHGESLSVETISRASSTLEYMSRCCVGSDGQLPNYGSNDGALFFRFNDRDYSDFRPQLNALARVLDFDCEYDQEDLMEDASWMCQNLSSVKKKRFSVNSQIKNFPHGGIYTIKDTNTFSFLKCTKYKDRPAHADNMHLDIWVDGINYLRDSGTYKYNTEAELINYFAGTAGHNTVILDDHNQMTKGPRFIWYNWTNKAFVNTSETEDAYIIQSSAEMYPSTGKLVTLTRKVIKQKNKSEWTIIDQIDDNSNIDIMRQFWHPHPDHADKISITAYEIDDKIIKQKKNKGYWSEYYGIKEEVPLWEYVTEGKYIKTKIIITN